VSIVIDNDLQSRLCDRVAAVRPSARPTIRDVAAEAGVSTATVSKVLNRRHGVAPATSARVLAVIEQTGYSASLVAQSLRNQRTNVIGILVADVEPFSAELLKGAADAIRGSGYDLVVYSAGGRTESREGWERRYLSRLSGTLIDAAIVVTPTVVEVNYGAPVVAVDPHTGPSALPTVDSDNVAGASLATQHLIELGHRRIAMLTGRPDLQSSRLREQGFRTAMAAAGIPVDESMVLAAAYEDEYAQAATRELLARTEPPTALFAANDVMAAAAIRVARDLGMDVPGALSVVGFDNIPELALSDPPLTTVEQPIRQMGREAMTMVLGLVNGATSQRTHVTLPTRLIVRSSTRRLD
jgi:LacI family transcriptional regulator